MTTSTYTCANPDCKKAFVAKKADRRRGWARHCSKSCAAWTREKRLDRGNFRRERDDDYAPTIAWHDRVFHNDSDPRSEEE
jgi:hypothetical protein